MVARLQVKASQIGKILQTLENKSKFDIAAENEKHHRKSASHGQGMKARGDGPPQKKPHNIDPIPPFNANKIRKSPSVTTPLDPNPPTPSNETPPT